MKQLILALAGIALIASVDVASAQAVHHRHMVQRNVALRGHVAPQGQFVNHPNANFQYGPQPDYPQSPPGF
jgi:hypothetical protein